MDSSDENVDRIEVVDLTSILTARPVLPKISSKRAEKHGDNADLQTGLIGEWMVYKYLLKVSSPSETESIKWENENGESHLPYDISLVRNGIKHFIEVKATRTSNQNSFLLSLNQIEAILQLEDSFFIYRVYVEEMKMIILDKIRWRLKHKQQLVCFLAIQ